MSRPVIIIDTETTGLAATDACIWQVGAVALVDGRQVGEFTSRVQPLLWAFTERHREVPRKVSGLDDRALLSLLDAPSADRVCRNFTEWIGKNAGWNFQLLAYNVGFDSQFLARRPWYFDNPEIWGECLMLRAQEAMRASRWPKLIAACEHFGIPYQGAHDALNDARAAAQLYLALERMSASSAPTP